MQIYAIANQKGGTGKTTTAAAIATAAARNGQKVLCIDLDPQGQLSYTLAADMDKPGSYELLEGLADVDSLIQNTDQGVAIIPASWNLQIITTGRGSARRLQRAIEGLQRKFDVIVIDTPPTAGELQYNALQTATGLIVPIQADAYNLQSLAQIMDTAGQIMETNPDLDITGLILTQYDGRSILSRQMRDIIIQEAESADVPFLGTVRQGIAIKEAAALQRSLFEYAPKSKPAQDYLEIYGKLFTQEEI